MQCHEVKRLLPAYLAGESDLDCVGIKHHLKGCPECTRALEEERVLNSLLDTWQVPTPPADFSRQLVEKLTQAASSPKVKLRPFSLLQDVVAAAAAVMIVVSSAYSIAEKTPVPDYSAKIGVISQSLGNLSDSYVNISAHTVNRVLKSIDQFKIFPEGDEK